MYFHHVSSEQLPSDYPHYRCQLCSALHQLGTDLTHWDRERERGRIMDKPAQWQSGDPYSTEHGCVCVCTCVFVCVVCTSGSTIRFLRRYINLTQGHTVSPPQSSPFTPLLLFCSLLSLSPLPLLLVFSSPLSSWIVSSPILSSVLHGWMDQGGGDMRTDRWMGDGWTAGWLRRGGETERDQTPGRRVDWCTCCWKLKEDMTH